MSAHSATEPMPFVPSVPRSALESYDLGGFWDEVFERPGVPRPHYVALSRRLATLSPEEVEGRRRAADLSFRVGGITFAVNQGAEGVEKIMPFDLVPRVIVPEEWDRVSRGLEQRIRALNLFLDDVENVESRTLRLIQRACENLIRNAFQLRIELESGDSVSRSRDLEVHVAAEIFHALDVGKNREVRAVRHESHGDASDRRLDFDACIHQRKS